MRPQESLSLCWAHLCGEGTIFGSVRKVRIVQFRSLYPLLVPYKTTNLVSKPIFITILRNLFIICLFFKYTT